MERSDWLLAFVAAVPSRPVDPVRVQKGLFLLAMSGVLPPAERYRFEPYAYGPMSRRLYRDVRTLAGAGLLGSIRHERASWAMLRATAAGERRARELRAGRAGGFAEIEAIRAEIDGLSFADLLERVYARYPEYATRSVFRWSS